jgi:hypothetical protein
MWLYNSARDYFVEKGLVAISPGQFITGKEPLARKGLQPNFHLLFHASGSLPQHAAFVSQAM